MTHLNRNTSELIESVLSFWDSTDGQPESLHKLQFVLTSLTRLPVLAVIIICQTMSEEVDSLKKNPSLAKARSMFHRVAESNI